MKIHIFVEKDRYVTIIKSTRLQYHKSVQSILGGFYPEVCKIDFCKRTLQTPTQMEDRRIKVCTFLRALISPVFLATIVEFVSNLVTQFSLGLKLLSCVMTRTWRLRMWEQCPRWVIDWFKVSWGAFPQAFCQCFSLTNFISY